MLPAATAEANTRLCRQLEAQLAALPASGGSNAQAKRYDAAIGRQQQQMTKARQEGQRAGCGRAMFGSAVAFCGSLAASMDRMEQNLAKLQKERARLGGGDRRRERARIRAAIDVNGCRDRKPAAPAVKEASSQPATEDRTVLRPQSSNLNGRYRTMCVRTCDGYYFPISWSVSQGAFERDRNMCAAMCPGTQVELYYHRVPDQESEEMVSVATGLPYTEMTNAFRYRQPGTVAPSGCGCEKTDSGNRGFVVIGGDHGTGLPQHAEDEPTATAATAVPSPQPDLADAPESSPMPEAPARTAENEGDRTVRVVGPTFLPDPEGAIDLRVRDPHPVQ